MNVHGSVVEICCLDVNRLCTSGRRSLAVRYRWPIIHAVHNDSSVGRCEFRGFWSLESSRLGQSRSRAGVLSSLVPSFVCRAA